MNGKDIHARRVGQGLCRPTSATNPQEQSPQQANIVRLNLLRQMITKTSILQQRACGKLNLAASDEDVNAKLTEFKAPFTQEEFDKQLKQRNMSLDDLKLQIRRTLTSTKLINKEIESKINSTESDISGFYAAHKADFNVIEPQYHMAWVVVTGMPAQQAGNLQNNKATNDDDARKKIQAIKNRIDSGEDFGALAMNFSEDLNTRLKRRRHGFCC